MTPPIPIANLYYLLSYAWNHRLSEAELAAIDADSCPNLNNFFARILANATHRLLRRGLDQGYFVIEEETSRIRGRIDFSASIKNQTRSRGKLASIYDELSPDVLHNQILKATLRLLLSDNTVNAKTRIFLRNCFEGFRGVGDLRVTPHHFHRVQLHRNNRAYHYLLHLCELIHASLLPERSRDGSRQFRDFTRDEKLMPKVFESFVRHFAERQFPEANVSAMHINWLASDLGEATLGMLPRMISDVTIAWPGRKLILDCKYYQEALISHYDALRFRSGNLFQLNAYLTNQAAIPGWESVEGMLLYPSNGYHLDHLFTLHHCHRVRVSTIDLGMPWLKIEETLMGLIDPNWPGVSESPAHVINEEGTA